MTLLTYFLPLQGFVLPRKCILEQRLLRFLAPNWTFLPKGCSRFVAFIDKHETLLLSNITSKCDVSYQMMCKQVFLHPLHFLPKSVNICTFIWQSNLNTDDGKWSILRMQSHFRNRTWLNFWTTYQVNKMPNRGCFTAFSQIRIFLCRWMDWVEPT